jgi:hypothetical protein
MHSMYNNHARLARKAYVQDVVLWAEYRDSIADIMCKEAACPCSIDGFGVDCDV